MYEHVTSEDILKLIRELHQVLPKYGMTDANTATIVRQYRNALEDYDYAACEGGMKLGLREWDKFPAPARWLEKTREWVKHNRVKIEWRVEEDKEGHTIACTICKSYGRLAEHRRVDGTLYWRMIAPCDRERHHGGAAELIVSYPENFARWIADAEIAEKWQMSQNRETAQNALQSPPAPPKPSYRSEA